VGGKRRVLYARTRAEAARKLTDALRARDSGELLMSSQQTVGQFLSRWLAESARPSVRPLTYRGYEVNVRLHLVPLLGNIRLDRLTPQHVQAMVNAKLAEGLSAKTVLYVKQVLRTALEQARRWELVTRNVAAVVEGPRLERKPIEPLSPNEARAFLQTIRSHRLRALFLVSLTLGLRQAEVIGLRWVDVDMAGGMLRVQQQLHRIAGELHVSGPKSDRSRRMLALVPSVVEALQEHGQRQAAERGAAGRRWRESGLVFTTTVGTPLDARRVIREYHGALAAAGLARRRFHDLRHSCATLLLVQGVSPRVVMEVLGHSEIGVTMNIYSHVIPEVQREAAERLDALLSQESNSAAATGAATWESDGDDGPGSDGA
jgi:integrase